MASPTVAPGDDFPAATFTEITGLAPGTYTFSLRMDQAYTVNDTEIMTMVVAV